MAEDLKGYDGAVDGMEILHGITIATSSTPIQVSQAQQPQQEVDINSIVQRAIEVIGGREQAMRWLGTPVRALDYVTPVSRLHDPRGREQVLSVLSQLEHGIL